MLDQTYHAKLRVELNPEEVLHGCVRADDVKTFRVFKEKRVLRR